MSVNKLKIDERRKKILEMLRRDGQVRVAQLSKQLGATVVTIRSDLDALERDGYLERTQGGAVQSAKNFYHMELQYRRQKNADIKKQIAAAAARMIHDGDTLLINSGTTTYFTALELKQHKNLNVVTNSISLAVELGSVPTFRVILLGGEINTQDSFIYGEDAKRQLSGYKADYAQLSMDGICRHAGITTYHAEESVIDRLMIERSQKTIIVADSSKIGHESFSHVCALDEIDFLVTDAAASASCSELDETGITVVSS